MATEPRRRLRIRVEGVVQGVGFRPHVHRLAGGLRLGGWVRNDERGVVLEAEGTRRGLDEFVERLAAEAPPLARVERVTATDSAATGERRFRILASPAPTGVAEALVPVDTATCEACLAELLDPADRRHRYPFINCTDCGPRFTIIDRVPYDRARTTMAAFEMCRACRAEYEDPRDRRFHAEANACPACGPAASLLSADGDPVAAPDAVAAAAAALDRRLVVAVRGIGGYHLACRADDDEAVGRLRDRKRRDAKPFAVMVRDLEHAGRLVELTASDRDLLASRAAPIVVARTAAGAAVSEAVAPGLRELGVVLPYSPLHHLLLRDAGGPLVMTSGNISDEPIATRNEEALARLAPLVDLLLVHDRPIAVANEDSVARSRATRGPAIPYRVSRGRVPARLRIPVRSPRPVLGCGAERKVAVCLARDDGAWLGPHVGDLATLEGREAYAASIARCEALLGVAPRLVAHDLHPDYPSTRYALEREGVETLGVQHHHAHLAACLAEHGQRERAVGAIYDGAGHGPDGTVWGGELLAGDLAGFERVGSLLAVPQPGGDAAVREPWRMACAWLAAAEGESEQRIPRRLRGRVEPGRWTQVARLLRSPLAGPVTSSVGRLFDAVAALCGIRAVASHEGQAAAELEAAADTTERRAYPIGVGERPGRAAGALEIDPREAISAIDGDLRRGGDVAVVSARFHNGLAAATASGCLAAAEAAGVDAVVLSGGAFQNALLLERVSGELEAAGLRVLTHELVPPNDGGIALGQAAVAAARDALG